MNEAAAIFSAFSCVSPSPFESATAVIIKKQMNIPIEITRQAAKKLCNPPSVKIQYKSLIIRLLSYLSVLNGVRL